MAINEKKKENTELEKKNAERTRLSMAAKSERVRRKIEGRNRRNKERKRYSRI
ncbi:MAG TPA: hypothetical protein VK487_01020 [Candidatus Bathyarchaeia archaeon]|jgi:hypothetical protein|nr:hypothetical protein [Candidatus Bathyarchaeia archaeon]